MTSGQNDVINQRIAELTHCKATMRLIREAIVEEFGFDLSERAISSRIGRMRRRGQFGMQRYACSLSPRQRAAMHHIVAEEARRFRTDAKSIMAGARFGHMVMARHSAIRRIKAEVTHRGGEMSSSLIASFMGIDHTSILYAMGKLKRSKPRLPPLDRISREARDAA